MYQTIYIDLLQYSYKFYQKFKPKLEPERQAQKLNQKNIGK